MATTRRTLMAGAASGVAALLAPRLARAFAGDLADAPFIDAFGPVGTDDDTPTFVAALNSGAPVRLRATTYRVKGPVRARSPVVMLQGTPGLSRIVATGLAAGPWFRIESDGLVDFQGIVWDGAGAETGNEVGAVAVLGTPETCSFRRCAVRRGTTPAGLLLSLNLAGGDEPMLVLDEVQVGHNRGQGIWIEHATNGVLNRLRLHENGQAGLTVRRFANRAGAPIQRLVVRDSFAWKNGNAGFGVGNYNEALAGEPPVLGPDLPDAVDVELTGLFAWGNGGYGIAVQSQRVRVSGCRTRSNGHEGGIVANARTCDIQDCTVEDERAFGIDIGGSNDVRVTRCRIQGIDGVGLNAGGGLLLVATGNHITGCTREAVAVWNTERGGREHSWLKYRTDAVVLRDTVVGMERLLPEAAAIVVRDGARRVHLDGVTFLAGPDATAEATARRALRAATDSIRIERMIFSGNSIVPLAPTQGRLVVPDAALAVRLPEAFVELEDVLTATMAHVADGIGWIEVTSPGIGYVAGQTTARLVGDGDVEAVGALVPNIWAGGGGQLIGFRLRRHGRGFTKVAVVLEGPGSGAVMRVQFGMPLPRERHLVLHFPGGGRLRGRLPETVLAPGTALGLTASRGKWMVGERVL